MKFLIEAHDFSSYVHLNSNCMHLINIVHHLTFLIYVQLCMCLVSARILLTTYDFSKENQVTFESLEILKIENVSQSKYVHTFQLNVNLLVPMTLNHNGHISFNFNPCNINDVNLINWWIVFLWFLHISLSILWFTFNEMWP